MASTPPQTRGTAWLSRLTVHGTADACPGATREGGGCFAPMPDVGDVTRGRRMRLQGAQDGILRPSPSPFIEYSKGRPRDVSRRRLAHPRRQVSANTSPHWRRRGRLAAGKGRAGHDVANARGELSSANDSRSAVEKKEESPGRAPTSERQRQGELGETRAYSPCSANSTAVLTRHAHAGTAFETMHVRHVLSSRGCREPRDGGCRLSLGCVCSVESPRWVVETPSRYLGV